MNVARMCRRCNYRVDCVLCPRCGQLTEKSQPGDPSAAFRPIRRNRNVDDTGIVLELHLELPRHRGRRTLIRYEEESE